MPGSTVSYRRLSNELLDIRRETRWVEGGNRNTPFPLPPFAKGGSGGISEGVENPPKSPFKKGDFKASTLKDKSGLLKAQKSLDLRSYLLLLTYSLFLMIIMKRSLQDNSYPLKTLKHLYERGKSFQ